MAEPSSLTQIAEGVSAFAVIGAVGLLSYLASRKKPANSTVQNALFSPNDVRIGLETLKRIELFSERTANIVDDCKDSLDRIDRGVREVRESNERTADRVASNLASNAGETRRAADLVDKIMRNRPAQMPPGRWEPEK